MAQERLARSSTRRGWLLTGVTFFICILLLILTEVDPIRRRGFNTFDTMLIKPPSDVVPILLGALG